MPNKLQPGEAVVIIDYKMKLQLGIRLPEIQRDWYGKRGISLNGLLATAQVDENKIVSEVLDLWSEDTKQDSWFTQSAMDAGLLWMRVLHGCNRHFLASECICFLVCFENCVQLCLILPKDWQLH